MVSLSLTFRLSAAAGLCLGILACGAAAAETRPLETSEEWTYYQNETAKIEIPALIIAPKSRGDYPAVLYIHGRWGLSPEVKAHLRQIAERGIKVMAPDYHFARAVPMLAWFNEKELSEDILAAVPHLLALNGKNKKIGILGQDYGGFYAILAAEKFPASVGALMSYYPLTNDPSQPKPRHIYGYMSGVDKIKSPTLFMIGGEDREMRRISTKRVTDRLRHLKIPATLIEYPGANRCFDWRLSSGNLSDDMARADSLNQIVNFLKQNVGGTGLLLLQAQGWQVL